jgi:hypothetical protein
MNLKQYKPGRWLVWAPAGLSIALMVAGLSLQVATRAPFLGAPFLIHFSEVLALCGFAIVGSLILWRSAFWPSALWSGGALRCRLAS